VLSFPALLLLVAIGSLGVYLALPRGPESERRAVRLAGLGLGLIGAIFLAVASAGRLPESGASRLARPAAGLVFHALAVASLVFAGVAVTARRALWSIGGSGLLLLATAGLLAFLGSTGTAAFAGGLAVTAGAAAAVLFRRAQPSARSGVPERVQSAPREVSREPLLACVAGACLAAGLVTVVQAVAADELSRTIAIEANQRPPSQRHRAFPRRSAIERVTENAASGGGTSEEAAPTFRSSDLPLVSRAVGLAMLLLAVGTIGALSRRSPVAVMVSWSVMLQAIASAAGAFAALHGSVARAGPVWLPLAVLATEASVLAACMLVWSGGHRLEAGE
jgi:NADH:ubiquinone oxidoreductase subunit K